MGHVRSTAARIRLPTGGVHPASVSARADDTLPFPGSIPRSGPNSAPRGRCGCSLSCRAFRTARPPIRSIDQTAKRWSHASSCRAVRGVAVLGVARRHDERIDACRSDGSPQSMRYDLAMMRSSGLSVSSSTSVSYGWIPSQWLLVHGVRRCAFLLAGTCERSASQGATKCRRQSDDPGWFDEPSGID